MASRTCPRSWFAIIFSLSVGEQGFPDNTSCNLPPQTGIVNHPEDLKKDKALQIAQIWNEVLQIPTTMEIQSLLNEILQKTGEFQWLQQQQQQQQQEEEEEEEAAEQSQSFLISPAHPTYITPRHCNTWGGFFPLFLWKPRVFHGTFKASGISGSDQLPYPKLFWLLGLQSACRLSRFVGWIVLDFNVMFFHWRNGFWIGFYICIFSEREKESMSMVHHKIRGCLGCRHLLVHHLEAPSHLHQAHAFRNEGRPQKCWYKNRIRPHFH